MDELQFFRNAWNTCIELIKDRNFIIDDTYNQISDADFRYLLSEKNIDIYAENAEKNRSIYIKFLLTTKIKPTLIKNIVDEIKEQSQYPNFDLIIVLKSKPNNTITKIEKEKTGVNLQIMWCKQLQINITKHFLVPNHTKCSDEEVSDILKKYSLINKLQLPIVLRDDPVIRYYNFKSGDVIRITGTKLSMNNNYIFYRCVK